MNPGAGRLRGESCTLRPRASRGTGHRGKKKRGKSPKRLTNSRARDSYAALSPPHTFVGVVGMFRTIGAPSPQASGRFSYTFRSWSDGGAQTHTITTPAAGTTYTASFKKGK